MNYWKLRRRGLRPGTADLYRSEIRKREDGRAQLTVEYWDGWWWSIGTTMNCASRPRARRELKRYVAAVVNPRARF